MKQIRIPLSKAPFRPTKNKTDLKKKNQTNKNTPCPKRPSDSSYKKQNRPKKYQTKVSKKTTKKKINQITRKNRLFKDCYEISFLKKEVVLVSYRLSK